MAGGGGQEGVADGTDKAVGVVVEMESRDGNELLWTHWFAT